MVIFIFPTVLPPSPIYINRWDCTGFPGGSAGKECACSVGDLGSVLGLGRYPGEGKGYPLQYSGLENPYTVHGVAESWTQLSDFNFSLHSFILEKFHLLVCSFILMDNFFGFICEKYLPNPRLQRIIFLLKF